jgi:hypothetical protein
MNSLPKWAKLIASQTVLERLQEALQEKIKRNEISPEDQSKVLSYIARLQKEINELEAREKPIGVRCLTDCWRPSNSLGICKMQMPQNARRKSSRLFSLLIGGVLIRKSAQERRRHFFARSGLRRDFQGKNGKDVFELGEEISTCGAYCDRLLFRGWSPRRPRPR